MAYNFDDRLKQEIITLTDDNYTDDMLKLNGIYYQVNNPSQFNIGDTVIIDDVIVNKVMLVEMGDNDDLI
ncbi:hypothetical protein C6P11_01730 [Weissella confusa]|uniref:Uncharacterized protein n=1 Tax=Weissella confusa TaxID=1583 RepID=A0A4Z0S057_WEICO|nr:hypothetical protein C6P11_01730 [Weissella confusa]